MIRIALENGRDISMKLVVCGVCDNEWCVASGIEFNPSYCCYCGVKFDHYDEKNGTRRKLNGSIEENDVEDTELGF